MKKIVSFLLLFTLLAAGLSGIAAFAESELKPIYANEINDGTYRIEVDSSSSMFRVVDCRLVVAEGKMTAFMTMSGQGYGMVFLGTGEEALNADSAEYVEFTLNDEGQKVFEIAIDALDKKTDCAAWSIKKEKWYDRELIFLSETLPKGALKKSSVSVIAVVAAVALAAAVSAAVVLLRKKNRGKSKENRRPKGA